MKFSYNWLQSYFEKKLPTPEKLAEVLTLHFAEVEKVEKVGDDFVLDIDVRPNRAGDCFSHNGVAREISAILDFRLKIKDLKPKESKKLRVKDFIDVEFLGKGHCQRYAVRVVEQVKVKESPKWLKERLVSCGLRPINNIVDAANYVMLEIGQPLHTFDADKIEGKKIIVRFAKEGEKITTLDGNRVDLDDDILVIADKQKPMAIAGIKGGKTPEIDQYTKTVVIEAANFNSQLIRSASQKISLRTDASVRFEHGLDQNLTLLAADRVAALIQELAGGSVAKGVIDVCPKKTLPRIIKLDLAYAGNLLGVDISAVEIKRILTSLGFKIKNYKSKIKNFIVIVPTIRIDINIQEDLIEEIGRIYGYEKIPAVFPKASLILPKRNLDIFWEDMAKDILKELDFSEVYNYCFVSDNDKTIFGSNNLVEVENPLSGDQKYLRSSLIPNLLKVIQKNQKNNNRIGIFELGKIFRRIPGKIQEKRMLAIAINGEEFYQLKGVADTLLNKFGISQTWYDSYGATPAASKGGEPRPFGREESIWQRQKCAEIKIDGTEVGFLGLISPKILEKFKIPKATVLEIDFDLLSQLSSEEHEFRPISKFPAAVRDLAVLVPREVKVEDVLNKIEIAGGQIVRDIDLFDIYEGDELPGQKKNLAFHIIFQAENKTLSSEEIDVIFNKIIKTLEEMPEWQVRK